MKTIIITRIRTTQDIANDYLLRQQWNDDNYPNKELNNDAKKKRKRIRTVEKVERLRKLKPETTNEST